MTYRKLFARMAYLDFETEEILDKPDYPPEPVGVAIQLPGQRTGEYLAWGHPSGNTTSKGAAKKVLASIVREHPVCFHNAAFDLSVLTEKMGVAYPKEYHDTLFLAYLHDPHDKSLELKELYAAYSGKPARERDALRDWVLEHIKGSTMKNWGAHISKAPAPLVAKYAAKDVGMTKYVFEKFYPYVVDNGMLGAYERELKMVPVIRNAFDKHGIRIDLKRLKKNAPTWEKSLEASEKAVRKLLRVGADVNLNSDAQLADALDARGFVKHWVMTPSGKRSTSRDNLAACISNAKFLAAWQGHAKMDKLLNTYVRPWIANASRNGGRIFPSFNQVRSPDDRGTRSGRFSCNNPNFQNVPKAPKELDEGMPFMRDYIIPDEGCVLLSRDYSQQEFRILAHFAGGDLLRRYIETPDLDMHKNARAMVLALIGIDLGRDVIKTIGFGTIYGMGITGMALKLGVPKEEASKAHKAYISAIPEMKSIQESLKALAAQGQPLRTWGGRLYFCEEPKFINGRMQTFEYKMLNYLIQPSAADCTKEAMLRCYKKCEARMTLQVHDELIFNAPVKTWKRDMQTAKDAMESVEFKVKMLSDGKWSRKSWGQMSKCL